MKAHIAIFTLSMALHLCAQSGANPRFAIPKPPPGHSRLVKPLFKGAELYSWQSNGTWHFSLLIGTNINKPVSVITNSRVRLSESDLFHALQQLAPGENVSWSIPAHRNSKFRIQFAARLSYVKYPKILQIK